MDEKHNTLLARGAANDITRLRWRIKICENVVARLVAENERLRNASVESCEAVACDETSAPEATDLRSITSHQESDEKRTNTTMSRDDTPAVGSVQDGCTLTDAERAAILTAADLLIGGKPGAILRNLLARLS